MAKRGSHGIEEKRKPAKKPKIHSLTGFWRFPFSFTSVFTIFPNMPAL